MSGTLLNTKLYVPPPRQHLVPRPQLMAQLSEGLAQPLTLVCAPAGFGKTTLISAWVADQQAQSGRRAAPRTKGTPAAPGELRIAWLSLDDDDNDPIRFLTYVIGALGTVKSGLGSAALSVIQSPQPPPTKTILTGLINELAALTVPLLLVLDDYHVINAAPVHEATAFLLDHLPPFMHLAILTRTDPPLPLARLRAGHQILELRADQLRFTQDEAAAFLHQVMGLQLSTADVAALSERTEGWIAGLQMAGLSMRGRDDVQSFVASFGGSHRYVMDYLLEEVLDRQSKTTQQFLLQTSTLNRMCASLCDAVLGIADSQTILETLEHANAFVITLDAERHWYRYHHLFADLLRERLSRLKPDPAPALRRRASLWHAQHGFGEEAIAYALAACDFERAADLIGQLAPQYSAQGRVASVSAWLGTLPEPIVAARPRLGLEQTWALYFGYKFDEAEARLRQIEQALTPEGAALVGGELALWRGITARRHDQLQRSLECLQEALDLLPAESLLLRGRAWLFMGLVYQESDARQSQQALSQALTVYETTGNTHGVVAALYFLAWVQRLQGELRQAARTSQRALQVVEPMAHWPMTCYAHIAQAELQYEWNDLAGAAESLAKATELANVSGNVDYLVKVTMDSARLQRAHGKWTEAQTLIDRAAQMARPAKPMVTAQVDEEQSLLWLAQNRSYEAMQTAQAHVSSAGKDPLLARAIRHITWARAAITQNTVSEVLQVIPPLLDQVEHAGMNRLCIQLLVLHALALQARGDLTRALGSLQSALSLAEPEGYMRIFLDEGAPLAALLRRAGSHGIAPAYVSRLLRAFGAGAGITLDGEQPLSEPLSERELEVLRLLAAGKSNHEIAAELILATGTVKKHLSNIFGKLHVENRTQCVARARELRLL